MVFRPRGVGADRRRVHERGDARLGDGAKHARRAVDIHPPEQRRIARRLDQPGEVDDGVGFAIPSNTIKSVATQLISSGKAAHAYLGVELGSNGAKARVVSVRTGTPAAKAALRAGDVIVSLGGTKIATSDDLRAAINSRKPGDHVSVTYTRNGKRHTVSVTLGSRPS